MKFPIISTIAVSLCAVAATVQADIKVASINEAELISSYFKTFEMQDRIDSLRNTITADIKQRQDKLQALQDEDQKIVAKLDPSLSDSARRKISEEHSAKKNEIQSYQQELQTYAQRRDVAFREHAQRELSDIVKDVQAAVEEVSTKGGYDLIVDANAVSATGTKAFPYIKPSFDITPEVLKVLNKNAPAGFDPAAERQKRATAAPAAPAAN